MRGGAPMGCCQKNKPRPQNGTKLIRGTTHIRQSNALTLLVIFNADTRCGFPQDSGVAPDKTVYAHTKRIISLKVKIGQSRQCL